MRGFILAKFKGGCSEEDLCSASNRYAELAIAGKSGACFGAPGHNNWGLAELMGRDEGVWIDRMLDPGYKGIFDTEKTQHSTNREALAEMEDEGRL